MDYRTYPRKVPAEAGTPTLTPHSHNQLFDVDGTTGFYLLRDPEYDTRHLAYLTRHGDDGYTHTIYTEQGSRSYKRGHFQSEILPRLSNISVHRSWTRRLAIAVPDTDSAAAVLTLLGRSLPGYDPDRTDSDDH